MSTDLAIPSAQELEAFSPAERWTLEETLGEAQGVLREYNDDEGRPMNEEVLDLSAVIAAQTDQLAAGIDELTGQRDAALEAVRILTAENEELRKELAYSEAKFAEGRP